MSTKGVVLPTRTLPIPVSAIQAPTNDGSNHATILRQIKESVEVAARQRGDPGFSYVRANELVALGLATMVNGALQLAGGAVASPLPPVSGGGGGGGGGGPGVTGATGSQGLPGAAMASLEDPDDAPLPMPFQLPMLDQMSGSKGSIIGDTLYRDVKGWTVKPINTLARGLPVFMPDDPEDALIIPGPIGVAGAAGVVGPIGPSGASAPVVTWPDDPDDILVVPGPIGLPGGIGATGTIGPAGTNANIQWPDDPDDIMIVPGPIGLTGVAGPAGQLTPHLYPDDADDIMIVPGPIGLVGAAGPAGQISHFLYPDDIDDDSIRMPGPIGLTGAAGPMGQIAPHLYPDDVDDMFVVPGPIGLTGAAGPAGLITPAPWPDDPDDNALIVPGPIGLTGPAGPAPPGFAWAAYLDADRDDDLGGPYADVLDMNYPYVWTGAHIFKKLPSIQIPGALHPVFSIKSMGGSTTDYVAFEAENAQGYGVAVLAADNAYTGAVLTNGPTGGQVNVSSYGGGGYPIVFGVDGVMVAYFDPTGSEIFGDTNSLTFRTVTGLTQLSLGSTYSIFGVTGSKTTGAVYSAYPYYIYASNPVVGSPTAVYGLSNVGLTIYGATGTCLSLAPNASNYAQLIVSVGLAAGTSYGMRIQAATNASDYALRCQTQAGVDILSVLGSGSVTVTGSLGLTVNNNANCASNLFYGGSLCDQSYVNVAPVTGATVVANNNQSTTLCKPAGTIAALTFKMPTAPYDGHIIYFSTSQIITTLTVLANTGQTLLTAFAQAAAAGSAFSWIYDQPHTSWYRRS